VAIVVVVPGWFAGGDNSRRSCIVGRQGVRSLRSKILAAGCGRVRARSAFKDGNKAYKEENFKQAVKDYQHAVDLDPTMAEAMFYLGSSHQAQFRPGKETPENKAHLDEAIKWYKASLEANTGANENLKKARFNSLAALTGIYSDVPYKDFDQALSYADQLVKENPTDSKNLFAMANLYEKFEKIDGQWTPMLQEMRDAQDPHWSRLELSEIKYNAQVPEEAFNKSYLTR
jgi:tetratricopeptide (TPR) repeat protein